jgi:hypothetical protein
MIGPEIRRMRYSEEKNSGGEFCRPDYNDSAWQTVSNGFGPAFYKIGPLPDGCDLAAIKKYFDSGKAYAGDSIYLNGKYYKPSVYHFSWRYGVENDPGHQGYHGLKEEMYDEFIRLGKKEEQWTTTVYNKEEGGSDYFLFTAVDAPSDSVYEICTGKVKPSSVWINGREIPPAGQSVSLNKGSNSLLLRYSSPCTAYYIIKQKGDFRNKSVTGSGSLAMKWYADRSVIKFNIKPQDSISAGWFRFKTAPGLQKLSFAAHGKVRIWIDGKECSAVKGTARADGSFNYTAGPGSLIPGESSVAIRIEQEKGIYAGAALPEPVKMTCGEGLIKPGDWSLMEGLNSYSGGAWYRKNIILTGEQCGGRLAVDLGRVACSAELFVNGSSAGKRLFPPYSFEISSLVHEGVNKIEVLVYNTAANHYSTVPTRYRKSLESGLIGPVKIISSPSADIGGRAGK